MGRKTGIGMVIIAISVITRAAAPLIAAGSPPSAGGINFTNTEPALAGRIEDVLPLAAQMLDDATAVLEKGWDKMSPEEQALFLHYFDPGKTGDVDEDFVRKALENIRKIRSSLDREITMVYKPDAEQCFGMRLYYTDFSKVYLCPYLYEEQNPQRMARDLAHEMAHISMLVLDRAYYSASDSRYLSLTPNGHWTAELPLVGKVLREAARADTLYHPDAYSRYAAAVASE